MAGKLIWKVKEQTSYIYICITLIMELIRRKSGLAELCIAHDCHQLLFLTSDTHSSHVRQTVNNFDYNFSKFENAVWIKRNKYVTYQSRLKRNNLFPNKRVYNNNVTSLGIWPNDTCRYMYELWLKIEIHYIYLCLILSIVYRWRCI